MLNISITKSVRFTLITDGIGAGALKKLVRLFGQCRINTKGEGINTGGAIIEEEQE